MVENLKHDVDSIVNLSGGLECAAALWYAKAKGYNPVALHLYNKAWGESADAQLEAAQKQADLMKVRLLVDEANMPQDWNGLNYPVLQHQSAICTLIQGNRKIKWKAIIWGANSDDSFKQRLQLKFPFRALACGWSKTLDPHGIHPRHVLRLPINLFPFEWMQKSEIVAALIQAKPDLLELVHSCIKTINKKPCEVCTKCIELTYAKRVAMKSVNKRQEGIWRDI